MAWGVVRTECFSYQLLLHFLKVIITANVFLAPSLTEGSATQKAGCRGGQAVAENRGGLRSGDARQGAAAKSGPVWRKTI